MRLNALILVSFAIILIIRNASSQWFNGCLGEKMAVYHYMTFYDFNHTAEMFDNNATKMCENFLFWGECLKKQNLNYGNIRNEMQKFIDRDWEAACGDPAAGAPNTTSPEPTTTTKVATTPSTTLKPTVPAEPKDTTLSELCHIELFRVIHYDPDFKVASKTYAKEKLCSVYCAWDTCLDTKGLDKGVKNRFPFNYTDGGWERACKTQCPSLSIKNRFTQETFGTTVDYYATTPSQSLAAESATNMPTTCPTGEHYEECPKWKDILCADLMKGNMDRHRVSDDRDKYCNFGGCRCANGFARGKDNECIRIGDPGCVAHITISL